MSSVCLTLHENVCWSLHVCVNFTSVKPMWVATRAAWWKKKSFFKEKWWLVGQGITAALHYKVVTYLSLSKNCSFCTSNTALWVKMLKKNAQKEKSVTEKKWKWPLRGSQEKHKKKEYKLRYVIFQTSTWQKIQHFPTIFKITGMWKFLKTEKTELSAHHVQQENILLRCKPISYRPVPFSVANPWLY